MIVHVDIDEAGERTLAILERFSEGVAEAARASDNLRRIGDAIRTGIARNFDREQAGDEYPWMDLALSTQRERERLGFPPRHPILKRTGKYRRSFTDENHPYHVFEFNLEHGGFSVRAGSSDPRVDVLEFGDDLLVPARAATYLNEDSLQSVAAVFHDLILEVLLEE